MSEVYANVPMYIDWIINQKRAHETTGIEGRDVPNDVSTAEPISFEIVLNILLILQIYWLQNDKNTWFKKRQSLCSYLWVNEYFLAE